MARKQASSAASSRTNFTKLSASQQSDFKEAKAEMSTKYLPRPARMNMHVMAFHNGADCEVVRRKQYRRGRN